MRETAVMIGRTRIQGMGPLGYGLTWMTLPLMQVLMLAFIYRDDRELLEYAVVAGAGMGLLFGLIFNGGEILDSERGRGTLGNLFLAPMPRFVWLGGFQVFALVESLVNGTIAVAAGAWWFGVDLRINLGSLAVTIVLFTAALWGMSVILGSLGLVVRNANFLSNLIFPFLALVSGTMYPVALMPDWVRIPARMLPFSYGVEALVASMTQDASIADLGDKLLPLLGFAIVLPLLGIVSFRAMEHAVRQIGSLEIA
jgi:ABC-2 type transport system permease protein